MLLYLTRHVSTCYTELYNVNRRVVTVTLGLAEA